jgi:hypothetical protein
MQRENNYLYVSRRIGIVHKNMPYENYYENGKMPM